MKRSKITTKELLLNIHKEKLNEHDVENARKATWNKLSSSISVIDKVNAPNLHYKNSLNIFYAYFATLGAIALVVGGIILYLNRQVSGGTTSVAQVNTTLPQQISIGKDGVILGSTLTSTSTTNTVDQFPIPKDWITQNDSTYDLSYYVPPQWSSNTNSYGKVTCDSSLISSILKKNSCTGNLNIDQTTIQNTDISNLDKITWSALGTGYTSRNDDQNFTLSYSDIKINGNIYKLTFYSNNQNTSDSLGSVEGYVSTGINSIYTRFHIDFTLKSKNDISTIETIISSIALNKITVITPIVPTQQSCNLNLVDINSALRYQYPQSTADNTSNWQTISSNLYGIDLKIPQNFKQNTNVGSSLSYDGSYQGNKSNVYVTAINVETGSNLSDAVKALICKGLTSFGQNPVIGQGKFFNGYEARTITPSSDVSSPSRTGALLIQMPSPIKIPEGTFNTLIIYSYDDSLISKIMPLIEIHDSLWNAHQAIQKTFDTPYTDSIDTLDLKCGTNSLQSISGVRVKNINYNTKDIKYTSKLNDTLLSLKSMAWISCADNKNIYIKDGHYILIKNDTLPDGTLTFTFKFDY